MTQPPPLSFGRTLRHCIIVFVLAEIVAVGLAVYAGQYVVWSLCQLPISGLSIAPAVWAMWRHEKWLARSKH
jgi:hypothetical protein